jgi:preprotein translocase subunit Sss1
MGLAISLIIAAVGLILALAVHPTDTSQIDVNTVGWILFLVGLVGFIIDLLLWSSWGPGYLRRDSTYVERRAPAYPARRRRVVEEIDDPAAGPPPGY